MSLVNGLAQDLANLSAITKTAVQIVQRVQTGTADAFVARGWSMLHEAVVTISSSQDATSPEERAEFSEKLRSMIAEGDSVRKELRTLDRLGLVKQLLRLGKRSKLWARASAFESNAASILTDMKSDIVRRLADSVTDTSASEKSCVDFGNSTCAGLHLAFKVSLSL